MFLRVAGASAADDAVGAVVGASAVADAAGPIAFRLEKTFFRRLASGTFADGDSRPLAFGTFPTGLMQPNGSIVTPSWCCRQQHQSDWACFGPIQPTLG